MLTGLEDAISWQIKTREMPVKQMHTQPSNKKLRTVQRVTQILANIMLTQLKPVKCKRIPILAKPMQTLLLSRCWKDAIWCMISRRFETKFQ
jgi:hypothetical protein